MTYKDVLELLQPHFGGSGTTSTMGSIAPELRGLYQSSADALVGQQEANPLGDYNESHPMQVAGVDPLQQFATSMMMGGNLPTGLDAMTLQGIMRQPGLAGAGPTSGQYDYGSEAGLGDMQAFMSPTMGVRSGEDGFAFPRSDQTLDAPNMDPSGAAPAPNYDLSDILAPPPSQFNPLSDSGPGGMYGGGQGGGQQINPGGGSLSDLLGPSGGGGFRGTPEQQAAAAGQAANGPYSAANGRGNDFTGRFNPGGSAMSPEAIEAEMAKYGVSMGTGAGGWGNFSGPQGSFQMTGAMHEGGAGAQREGSNNNPMGSWMAEGGIPAILQKEMAKYGSQAQIANRSGVQAPRSTTSSGSAPTRTQAEKDAEKAKNAAAAEAHRASYR